jgi:CTP synthase
MQMAIIEFARNVLGYKEANSTEFDPQTPYPLIDLMPEQKEIAQMGGTMRLVSYDCRLEEDTFAFKAYDKRDIKERHRHRFEFNNAFMDELCAHGMRVAGVNVQSGLVEIMEIKDHPWFVAVQFHPEFKSRPTNPHPLFRDFIAAAKK